VAYDASESTLSRTNPPIRDDVAAATAVALDAVAVDVEDDDAAFAAELVDRDEPTVDLVVDRLRASSSPAFQYDAASWSSPTASAGGLFGINMRIADERVPNKELIFLFCGFARDVRSLSRLFKRADNH
jgi:hypothetical protein